jgi:prophage regulatory protein
MKTQTSLQALEHDRVVREPERERITGVTTSRWYVLQDEGKAPRPIPIGVRARGWLLSELLQWVAEQRAKRDAEGGEHNENIHKTA